jgi:hypothetical protein
MDGKIKAATAVARMWLAELEFIELGKLSMPALAEQTSVFSTQEAPSQHSAASGGTCDAR